MLEKGNVYYDMNQYKFKARIDSSLFFNDKMKKSFSRLVESYSDISTRYRHNVFRNGIFLSGGMLDEVDRGVIELLLGIDNKYIDKFKDRSKVSIDYYACETFNTCPDKNNMKVSFDPESNVIRDIFKSSDDAIKDRFVLYPRMFRINYGAKFYSEIVTFDLMMLSTFNELIAPSEDNVYDSKTWR